MNLDIKQILTDMAKKRPLFQNEIDFQFHFAIHLKKMGFEIYLEKYIGKEENKRQYIDLVAINKETKECYLFEFKYKTAKQDYEIKGEKFNFFDQGARDLGAYAVWRDVERLEKQKNKAIDNIEVTQGFVIFLTNDPRYSKGFRKGSLFANYGLNVDNSFPPNTYIQFNIPTGKVKEDTCAKYLKEIIFNNRYIIKWEKYSEYLDRLVIEIKKKGDI